MRRIATLALQPSSGRAAHMPALELSDAQVTALAAYLSTLR